MLEVLWLSHRARLMLRDGDRGHEGEDRGGEGRWPFGVQDEDEDDVEETGVRVIGATFDVTPGIVPFLSGCSGTLGFAPLLLWALYTGGVLLLRLFGALPLVEASFTVLYCRLLTSRVTGVGRLVMVSLLVFRLSLTSLSRVWLTGIARNRQGLLILNVCSRERTR